jgi:hypothetical protein
MLMCVSSCAPSAGIKRLQSQSTQALTRLSNLASSSVDSLLPSRVKVVEVREKDLKELPTGKERALAYQNERKRGFWFFNSLTNFQEPTLPEMGADTSYGLLPPREP